MLLRVETNKTGRLPAEELKDELVLILSVERLKDSSDHTCAVQPPGQSRC